MKQWYALYVFLYSYYSSEQKRNILIHDIRHADDLHVPYGRLGVRNFSIKIAGANLWSSIPLNIKNPISVDLYSHGQKDSLLVLYYTVALIALIILFHEIHMLKYWPSQPQQGMARLQLASLLTPVLVPGYSSNSHYHWGKTRSKTRRFSLCIH